jgi:hypothetical protein
MELIAVLARDQATDSSTATLVNNLYGPPVIIIGAGLVDAGIVFVPLTPAIMGTFVAGRLGIGCWMLLFAGFGYGLLRLANDVA